MSELTPKMDVKLFDAARTLGTRIVGEAGCGKSALMAWLAFADCVRNFPLVIWDNNGELVDDFFKMVETSPDREKLRPRIRYVELGNSTFAYGMPFYYDAGRDHPYVMSQRLVDIMIKLDPDLKSASVLGESSLSRFGTSVGTILASVVDEKGNRWQVTEAMDLLENYKSPRWQRIFEQVKPKAAREVDFIRKTFAQWRPVDQSQRYYTFETRIRQYINSPTLRAIVGQGKPTIDWSQVDRDNLAVIFDFRGLNDKSTSEQLSVLIFDSFLEYIRRRGTGSKKPISMVVDELSAFLEHESLEPEVRSLATRFRAYKLWPTIGHQALNQLSPKLRASAWSFGNQIIGRQANYLDSEEVIRTIMNPENPAILPGVVAGWQQMEKRSFMFKRFYDEGTPDLKVRLITIPDIEPFLPGKVTDDQLAAAKLRNQLNFAPQAEKVLKEIDARLGPDEPPPQKRPKA